jgi:hypothetical protein
MSDGAEVFAPAPSSDVYASALYLRHLRLCGRHLRPAICVICASAARDLRHLRICGRYLRPLCASAHLRYQRMRKPRRVVNGARMFAGRW